MLFAQRRSKLEGIRMERLWASQADDSGVRRKGRDYAMAFSMTG